MSDRSSFVPIDQPLPAMLGLLLSDMKKDRESRAGFEKESGTVLTKTVPAAWFDNRAQKQMDTNHSQSFRGLWSRGGLGAKETLAVLYAIPYRDVVTDEIQSHAILSGMVRQPLRIVKAFDKLELSGPKQTMSADLRELSHLINVQRCIQQYASIMCAETGAYLIPSELRKYV